MPVLRVRVSFAITIAVVYVRHLTLIKVQELDFSQESHFSGHYSSFHKQQELGKVDSNKVQASYREKILVITTFSCQVFPLSEKMPDQETKKQDYDLQGLSKMTDTSAAWQ